MNKWVIGLLVLGLLMVTLIAFKLKSSSQQNKIVPSVPVVNNSPEPTTPADLPVDYRADFIIFTNNTLRVFTDSRYHNKSGDVYIEAQNPNTIVIKKQGITWSDFFETLPMTLAKDCLITGTNQTFCTNQTHELKFYLNGVKDNDALDKQINNGDKLLVSYGVNDDPNLQQQLEK